MSIEDKLAIHEIIAQYSSTYDGKDAEGFAQLFVEDGVFEVLFPGQTTASIVLKSKAEICKWAAQRFRERIGRFTSRHYQSGTLFDELKADSARTRTMVLVTHQDVAEAAPRATVSGVYHDQWRKTQAGWRFAHRSAHLDQVLRTPVVCPEGGNCRRRATTPPVEGGKRGRLRAGNPTRPRRQRRRTARLG